jgi:hypothetical protein
MEGQGLTSKYPGVHLPFLGAPGHGGTVSKDSKGALGVPVPSGLVGCMKDMFASAHGGVIALVDDGEMYNVCYGEAYQ